MFQWHKPTAQIQGNFLDWSDKHVEAIQNALTNVGQVVILIESLEDNKHPYGFENTSGKIVSQLAKLGYVEGHEFIIMQIPKITKVIDDQR